MIISAAAIWLSFISLVNAAAPNILVYSKTAGYRHDSIPTAINALKNIQTTSGLYNATFSEDENLFTLSQLQQFQVIVFLSNSDQVLTLDGEDAFRRWLTQGKNGLVGLHAATACEFNDTAFGVAMGSWFDYHPGIQNATFTKLISHTTIDPLPDRYNIYEEVYNFRTDPRDVNATVLLTVDSSSYVDPLFGTTGYFQGTPHPIAWLRDTPVDLGNGTHNGTHSGRMWMTSLGHTNDTWGDPVYLAHVQAGLQWVIEGLDATSNATTTSSSTSAPSHSLSEASPSAPHSSTTTSSSAPASATSSKTGGSARLALPLQVVGSTIILFISIAAL